MRYIPLITQMRPVSMDPDMSDDPGLSGTPSGSTEATDPASPMDSKVGQPWNGAGRDQAAQLDALGTMASSVAHEFNNLLTIVLGSLEQLRRQQLDDRGRDQLDRAEWGTRQAGRLADQVLSFTRFETGSLQRIDMNEVIGNFDKMVGHAADYGGSVSVKLELAPQRLPVQLDQGQLELALLNLVRNAADAMGGSGTVVVRTMGHRFDGLGNQPTVEVAVSDTGAGMPPEVVQRATEPFFTTKKSGQGTGLGLWMVQKFVSACGGKLVIETATGRGTMVRLVFPRSDEV